MRHSDADIERAARRFEELAEKLDAETAEVEQTDVTAVRVLARYFVELTFDTGEVKVLDLEPLLDGAVFAPLTRDYELFRQVRADKEAGTIVWPNGADLSPRTLYERSRATVPHAS